MFIYWNNSQCDSRRGSRAPRRLFLLPPYQDIVTSDEWILSLLVLDLGLLAFRTVIMSLLFVCYLGYDIFVAPQRYWGRVSTVSFCSDPNFYCTCFCHNPSQTNLMTCMCICICMYSISSLYIPRKLLDSTLRGQNSQSEQLLIFHP